jgi:hypothetical protein
VNTHASYCASQTNTPPGPCDCTLNEVFGYQDSPALVAFKEEVLAALNQEKTLELAAFKLRARLNAELRLIPYNEYGHMCLSCNVKMFRTEIDSRARNEDGVFHICKIQA